MPNEQRFEEAKEDQNYTFYTDQIHQKWKPTNNYMDLKKVKGREKKVVLNKNVIITEDFSEINKPKKYAIPSPTHYSYNIKEKDFLNM